MSKIVVTFVYKLKNEKVVSMHDDEYADYELADLGYLDGEIDLYIKAMSREMGIMRDDIASVHVINRDTKETIHTKRIG